MSPETMHEIASACVRECLRQQVGVLDLAHLVKAYAMVMESAFGPLVSLPTELGSRNIAAAINGRAVTAWPLGYRMTPVTFANGRAGTAAREVPDAMQRLFEALDDDTDPAEFVRAFLSIHPFTDGNGRTAFILFNWLSNTLDHPQALPDLNWDE